MTDTREELRRSAALTARCEQCQEWAFQTEPCGVCEMALCDDCWSSHLCDEDEGDR